MRSLAAGRLAPPPAGGDRIVATTGELEQAEPVPEGVSHHRDAVPFVRADRLLEPRTRCLGPADRGRHVRDDEVQVHRRPMASVVAPLRRGRGRAAAGGLGQEVDRAGRAQHLHPELAEAAPGSQPEGAA